MRSDIMNRLKRALAKTVYLCAVCAALMLSASCGPSRRPPPEVSLTVASATADIAALVDEIGRPRAKAILIIPAAACPGHFDVSAAVAAAIERAGLFIERDWQKASGKFVASESSVMIKRAAASPGNWMIPRTNISAAAEIAGFMSEADPDGKNLYEKNLAVYAERVRRADDALEPFKKKFRGKQAITSDLQSEFLKWLGFEVVGVFPRKQDLTASLVAALVKEAKKRPGIIIAENLQSGDDAGRMIAIDAGARRVVLSNFPLNGSYTETLGQNAKALAKAIDEYHN